MKKITIEDFETIFSALEAELDNPREELIDAAVAWEEQYSNDWNGEAFFEDRHRIKIKPIYKEDEYGDLIEDEFGCFIIDHYDVRKY